MSRALPSIRSFSAAITLAVMSLALVTPTWSQSDSGATPTQGDGLFETEGLTSKEREAVERQLENISQAMDAIASLRATMLVHQVSQGDCDPIIEIDQLANQGQAIYQHIFGSLFLEGLCVEQSDARAIEWITKAAQNDKVESQHLLAQFYYEGKRTEKNLTRSAAWFRRGAVLEHAPSQAALGQLYEAGEGVVQSHSKAYDWYSRAASNGDLDANARVALLYADGNLGKVDFKTALEWALNGAKRNSTFSQLIAAAIYIDRPRPDLIEAHKWLNLASQSTHPQLSEKAVSLRKQIEESMTRTQIVEAQNLATSWHSITAEKTEQIIRQENRLDPRDYPVTEVQNVQMALKELGFSPGSIDGVWGPRTDAAVRDFQAHTKAKGSYSLKENRLDTAITRLRSLRPGQPAPEEIDNLTPEEAKALLVHLNVPITKDAFFEAVEADNLSIFKLFYVAGADLETQKGSPSGITPLYVAVDFSSDRIYDFLMNHNVNVNVTNLNDGNTPLTRALSWDRVDIARELLDAGADASRQKSAEFSFLAPSALKYSLGTGDPDLVRRILSRGGDVTEQDSLGNNLLHFVDEDKDLEIAEILLDNGVDVNAENNAGDTPLLGALKETKGISLSIVRLLLSRGADPKATAFNPISPLLITILRGRVDVMSMLMSRGADPNEVYRFDRSEIPFGLADNKLIVDALMNGASPLMVAAHLNHVSIAKKLLDHGASPETTARGESGNHTAVSLAIASGNTFLADLIERNQKKSMKDD